MKTADGERWVTHSHIAVRYEIRVGYEIKYKISYIDCLDSGVAALISGAFDHWERLETLRSGS